MSVSQMVERSKDEVGRIRSYILSREQAFGKELSHVHQIHQGRARNLVHYLAFRERREREMHEHLRLLGLDPLLDVEWDVLGRITRVLCVLNEMSGMDRRQVEGTGDDVQDSGRELLRKRTAALFGADPQCREVRIMLTLPSEAADDARLVGNFVAGGADCFRINCARDNSDTWKRLIDTVRQRDTAGKRSLIFMDLGGAKLRVASCANGKKSIRLQPGESLFVRRAELRSPRTSGNREGPDRPEITVNVSSGLAGVLPGHRVWFDDGKIGGVVRETGEDGLRVEITHARNGGRKLRLERGLNLPDSPLQLPALTERDLRDLPFAARYADFLALSFIRTPADVDAFRSALMGATESPPAMVIKIETREALLHLPELMLAAMRQERVAMLLARGDLAVECGFLAMPQIQRDVLSYCAAASLPLFWATGIMERVSRTGEPSRAEITDAEEAARAQCIMLNKGPKIMDALRLLGALLERRKETL